MVLTVGSSPCHIGSSHRLTSLQKHQKSPAHSRRGESCSSGCRYPQLSINWLTCQRSETMILLADCGYSPTSFSKKSKRMAGSACHTRIDTRAVVGITGGVEYFRAAQEQAQARGRDDGRDEIVGTRGRRLRVTKAATVGGAVWRFGGEGARSGIVKRRGRSHLLRSNCGGRGAMGVSKGNLTEECVGDGVFLYTLERGGVRAVFSNWGATLMSLCVPDAQGEIGDIVLGFDTLGPYMDGTSPYFGSIVGRVANRIARGTFTLDGERFTLPINNGPNSLHGGHIGFDKVLWEARKVTDSNGPSVQFTYHSHDGEQGYPGELDVSVTYTLSSDNELRIEMEAKPVNKATPINLAQHSYFNLSGHGSGDVLQHRVLLWSTSYTALDDTQIPTGEIVPVQGTPFDFTEEASIGSRFTEVPGGYDHNFDLRSGLADPAGEMSPWNGEDMHGEGLRIAAKVWDPVSKRAMEVFTTAPGVQFYTGNFLDGVVGKGGAVYNAQAGLCLETQGFPNAVNESRFPSIIFRPGETYRHVMVYKFYTQS